MNAALRLSAVLLLVGCPDVAPAQVIEIGDDGRAVTYDQPTLFLDGGATALRPVAKRLPPSDRTGGRPTGDISNAGLLTQAARAEGVPEALLAAVAWQESRGRSNAISPRGAIGVMQLMPATAREIGVDPHDTAENILGGARYLRRQMDRFGSVSLALAAYNAGPAAVSRFGGIPPFRETRSYVSSILARLENAQSSAEHRAAMAEPIFTPTLLIEVPPS